MLCNDCQTLLLDHLYGLLDAAESQELEKHLAQCVECANALAEAARAQGLFARAARREFPQLRFAPPVDDHLLNISATGIRNRDEANTPETSSVPRRTTWISWVIAASAFILIPATIIPWKAAQGRFETAHRNADEALFEAIESRSALDEARNGGSRQLKEADAALASARNAVDNILNEWLKAERDAEQIDQERKLAVAISRPLSAQPGAPNDLMLTIRNKSTSLRGQRVEAQVKDQAGTILFTQKIDPENQGDKHTVRLPAEMWSKLKPDSDLYLAVSAIDEKTGTRTELRDRVHLLGPVYSTMLVTDKSAYRPGETVYFRSLTLDRVTLRPPHREQNLQFSLRRPDGQALKTPLVQGSTDLLRSANGQISPTLGTDGEVLRGVGCGSIAIPADLPDGDYLLTLAELPGRGGHAPIIAFPVTRTVKVRSGRPERYTKEIRFGKSSYQPGEKVEIPVTLLLAGQPVTGASVSGVAVADGNPIGVVRPIQRTTNQAGRAKLEFTLPGEKDLQRGDVQIMVTFKLPDGLEESAVQRVPVVGPKVIVELFPEGGNLIANIPNRVYVRATTPAGRPVDFHGKVTAAGETIAKVETTPDPQASAADAGIAIFAFTPQAGKAYRFELDGNGAATQNFPLPKVEVEGVAMSVAEAVVGPSQPLRVMLHSTGKSRILVVGAYTRGRIADSKRVTVEPGKPVEVELSAGVEGRGGVTRVTVFEEPAKGDLVPVAERLIFRRPADLLNLTLAKKQSIPGQSVEIGIQANDEKGKPTAAILWAAVVNSAVAPGASDRSVAAHFYLAGELQTPDDLEYADFLLSATPRAAQALDRVLATQGWRRFVEQERPSVVAQQPNLAAQHLLASAGAYPRPVGEPPAVRAHPGIYDKFWPSYESAMRDVELAKAVRKDAGTIQLDNGAIQSLVENYRKYYRRFSESNAVAAEALINASWHQRWVTTSAGGFAVSAAILWLAALTRQGGPRSSYPLLIASTLLGGLAGYLALDTAKQLQVAAADDLPDPDSLPKAVEAPAVAPAPQQSKVEGDALVKKKDQTEPRILSAKEPKKADGGTILLNSKPIMRPMITARIDATTYPGSPFHARPRIPEQVVGMEKRPGNFQMSHSIPSATASVDTTQEQAGAFARERSSWLAAPIEALLARQDSRKMATEAARMREAIPNAVPLIVREFAAPRPGIGQSLPDADTLLWQPVIVLPSDGKGTISFNTGVSSLSFDVLVAGHTLDGRLGTARMIVPPVPNAPTVTDPKK